MINLEVLGNEPVTLGVDTGNTIQLRSADNPVGSVISVNGKQGVVVLKASDIEGAGVPTNVREAIFTLLNNAAYVTTGLDDEIAIVEAWAEEVTSLTLSASTLELSGSTPQTITATTVPAGKSVSWSSSDDSVATVNNGTVTGVSNGTCTITASAGSLTATCEVTVSGFSVLESISAVYTQSGLVFDTDSLDSLKTDLVVTATYDDTSTATVPSNSYSLSGTLTEGTSTITVTYQGKTTTFNVTVSATSYTFTSSSDGVGFGSIGTESPNTTPPYVANTNRNRLHIMNDNSSAYPVKPSTSYEISISNPSAQQVSVTILNTTGKTNILNLESIASSDHSDTSWSSLSSGKYTFTTPALINGQKTACVWFVFRKNSSNANWSSLDTVEMFPITFKEI